MCKKLLVSIRSWTERLLYDFTYMRNLKKKKNKTKTDSETENELMITRGDEGIDEKGTRE